MSNDRVEAWLRNLGFDPEPEPKWVTGRKPDFFCPGAHPVWVEVKTFEPSQHSQMQDRAWQDFRLRVEKTKNATGEVYAMTSQTYTGAHGKVAARLLRHLAQSPAPASSDVREVIIIPPDPIPNIVATIRYHCREREVIQIGPKSVSNQYGYYPSYEPKDWSQEVVIACEGETAIQRQAYDIFYGDSEGPISLSYWRSESPLSLGALMSTGGYNTTAARIREAIDDANDQLRSGQSAVPAPGICVIYQESLEATGDRMLLAALFGDLTIPIALNPIQPGNPFLGRNGILSATKNRAVSAVKYVSLGSEELIVLNPYARFPIESRIFRAPVWMADGETFTLSVE
jgi:hypothetical protein